MQGPSFFRQVVSDKIWELKDDVFLPLPKISVEYERFLWVYTWILVVIKNYTQSDKDFKILIEQILAPGLQG